MLSKSPTVKSIDNWSRQRCRGRARPARRFALNGRRAAAIHTALAAVLAGAFFLASSRTGFAAEPNVGTDAGPSVTVTVTAAKKICFTDSIDVTGTLVPKQEIFVQPEHEGLRIAQVLVDAGDAVTAGQILARLTLPEGQPGEPITIESPAVGVVGKMSAVVGTLTSFRSPPLFQIILNGEIELLAEVSSKLVSRLAPGQPAQVKVVGIGIMPGRVRVVSPTVDAATQLGAARIFIGNDKRLRIGTFGSASVVAGQSCNLAVPLSAVLYGAAGAIVEVVRDDRVETRKVKIGLLSEGAVEVREGLSAGDMVVARAGAFLREGDRVRPVIVDEPATNK